MSCSRHTLVSSSGESPASRTPHFTTWTPRDEFELHSHTPLLTGRRVPYRWDVKRALHRAAALLLVV